MTDTDLRSGEPGEPGGPRADGRHARRQRNRDAVVDALLALYDDGDLDPSSETIAQRAGLSPRSLFRYFDDIDDLTRAAVAREYERVGPLLAVGVGDSDPLPKRIAALATQRNRLFEAVGAAGRVSRLRAPFQPTVAAELDRARSFLRHQVEQVLAPELTAIAPGPRSRVLAALDVLCSFEAHELMRRSQGLGAAQTERALVDAITRLLATTPTSATAARKTR